MRIVAEAGLAGGAARLGPGGAAAGAALGPWRPGAPPRRRRSGVSSRRAAGERQRKAARLPASRRGVSGGQRSRVSPPGGRGQNAVSRAGPAGSSARGGRHKGSRRGAQGRARGPMAAPRCLSAPGCAPELRTADRTSLCGVLPPGTAVAGGEVGAPAPMLGSQPPAQPLAGHVAPGGAPSQTSVSPAVRWVGTVPTPAWEDRRSGRAYRSVLRCPAG